MIPAVLTHCAGIDIGKRNLAVCLMVGPAEGEPKAEVREFSTFNADLEAMKKWLVQAGCTHVVMESTGPYWKPVFNILEDSLVVCLLLRYNLKTVRAYLLKEAFQQLWDYNSPAWAGKFLDDWCRQVMRSRIEPVKNIARSLRPHLPLSRTCALSLTWPVARAGVDPRVLLTNQNFR